jgi:hypothetical protein
MHQKENPSKPLTMVKRTREEMQKTLENRKKVVINSPRNAFKRKNKVEEGQALGSGMKREHANTNLRAQKMLTGRVSQLYFERV